MSVFTPTGGSATLTGGGSSEAGATSGNVLNVALTTAETEYSFVLPNGTLNWVMRIRNLDGKAAVLKYYFSSGDLNYGTVNPGGVYASNRPLDAAITVYVKSTLNSRVLEVIYYT